MALFIVTFTEPWGGYQSTEKAAFGAAEAAKLVSIGVGALSAEDQATLESAIEAAKYARRPVMTRIDRDAFIRSKIPPKLPNYGG